MNINFNSIVENRRNVGRMVLVYGNFNIVHPGHMRLLNFAKSCGDYLVVGISDDTTDGVYIPAHHRIISISSIGFVDDVFCMDMTLEDAIKMLKPDVVVKGKEFEHQCNPEKSLIEDSGGKLIFCSGDGRFSTIDLLKKELIINPSKFYINVPESYIQRHSISKNKLFYILTNFKNVRVTILGDLIVDQYIACDPIGMSQEDPTIVVTPVGEINYVGGAGIVAAHAASLGATVNFFTVTGGDQFSYFANEQLERYGVITHFFDDDTRPTTLKKRYRAGNKTLLRVSTLKRHEIDEQIVFRVINELKSTLDNTDLLVFADFNYGFLPQRLVNEIINICNEKGIKMVADSQSSSQSGDISRYREMLLITPTEHEARIACHDDKSGLSVLGNNLLMNTSSSNLFVTLGSDGMLIFSKDGQCTSQGEDQLPALNRMPIDVSGAGDSLLITSSLALLSGANIWESALLGSVAAACQVNNIGNLPLTLSQLVSDITS